MRYLAPTTLDDAIQMLSGDPGDCRVLAGGTDLLVRLRSGDTEPDSILDIKRIDDLRQITSEDGGWRIGAAVCCAEINEHDALKADYPGIAEAADLIGSTQIQGRCTLSGNLCNASPAADTVPAMVAVRATVRIVGPNGTRDVPVEDVPTSPGKTSLEKGEFVASIFLPAKTRRSSDAYLRFIPRTEMDIAVVGCGLSLTLDESGTCTDARVSLGAVGPTVMIVDAAADALIGTQVDDAALDALATACSAAATPIADKRGTVAFRTHVAGVLARRAAGLAKSRAEG